MINTYYLMQGSEQTGPFTQYEIMDMQLDVHTMVLSPLATGWEEMIDLPEFNYYFENRGIYPPNKSNYAHFGWRFLAYLIDTAIVILSVMMLSLAYNLFVYLVAPSAGFANENGLNLFFGLSASLYNATCESSRLRGSIGKVACKLCVVDVKGERLTFANALGRNFGKILSSIIFGLGFLRILWDDKRQGWHDELAKAYVIRRK